VNMTLRVLLSIMMLCVAGRVWSVTPAEQKIADRIKPVGQVCVEGQECEGAQAVATAAVASGLRSGEDIYGSTCFACHDTGAAGAPMVGDTAAWAPRIEQGVDTLISHAISGIRGMPPRGTCADCSDEEIAATVKVMVGDSQ